jgi:hypothetical protein
VTTGAQKSPSAFQTNYFNTYGRKESKGKPSESEFYNYGCSGNLQAVTSDASNVTPSIITNSLIKGAEQL